MFGKVNIVFFAVAVLFWANADAQTRVCGANEADSICGMICEPTCSNPNPSIFFCPPPFCLRIISGGCRCNPGYVRNAANNCVLASSCP